MDGPAASVDDLHLRLEYSVVGPVYVNDFDLWWNIYPRKKAKGAARKSFVKALRLISFEQLMDATRAYAEERKGEEARFTPFPATWLNQERYEDERDHSSPDQFKRALLEDSRLTDVHEGRHSVDTPAVGEGDRTIVQLARHRE